MILAIRHADGSTRFNPQAHEVIGAEDCLIAMGETAQLARLESVAASGAATRP
jgi:K+/H+ antiporter YhaU regulatory subunit KhtT